MKKFFDKIRHSVWSWFFYDSPIYISIENPWKTYNAVKKWFAEPHMSFNVDCEYSWFRRDNRIFEIQARDVTWKSKYCEPRHEHNPFFFVKLFNWYYGFALKAPNKNAVDENGKLHFNVMDNDIAYWESVITKATTKARLYEIAQENTWERHDEDAHYMSNVFVSGMLTSVGMSICACELEEHSTEGAPVHEAEAVEILDAEIIEESDN